MENIIIFAIVSIVYQLDSQEVLDDCLSPFRAVDMSRHPAPEWNRREATK
jgi:hypothetical protein